MIAATGNPAYRVGFEPPVAGFLQVDGGDIDKLAAAVDDEPAASAAAAGAAAAAAAAAPPPPVDNKLAKALRQLDGAADVLEKPLAQRGVVRVDLTCTLGRVDDQRVLRVVGGLEQLVDRRVGDALRGRGGAGHAGAFQLIEPWGGRDVRSIVRVVRVRRSR